MFGWEDDERTSDLGEAQVFADELEARGDPRGELLSLEIAGELASSSAEARRLNREAQRLRDAEPGLAWPPALADTSVSIRAGFPLWGSYEELFGRGLPIELEAGVRQLGVGSEVGLEEALAGLVGAAARGLRLDSLGVRSTPDQPIPSLERVRQLAELSHGQAFAEIELHDRAHAVEALTSMTGCRAARLGMPSPTVDLRQLASLPLTKLGLRGPLDPAIELFAATLTEVQLSGSTAAFDHLTTLPRLRRLTIDDAQPPADVLTRLTTLAHLHLSSLDELELAVALGSLTLGWLDVASLASALGPALGRLTSLERLGIHRVEGPPLDLAALAGLVQLRELSLPAELTGALVLPPTCRALAVRRLRGPIEITGTIDELMVTDCDPRCLPRALLAGVRRLTLLWFGEGHDPVMPELAQLCPRLERLAVLDFRRQRPRGLGRFPYELERLTELRSLSLERYPTTLTELAELAHAHPELCLLRDARAETSSRDWPRGSSS